ncbi:MAG: hypothetical protein U0744_12725 [Gemmataceae bacterium]
MLDLAHASPVAVLRASAKTGEGIAELWRHLRSLKPKSAAGNFEASVLFDRVAEEAGRRAMHSWSAGDAAIREISSDWQAGRLSESHAVDAVLRRIADRV